MRLSIASSVPLICAWETRTLEAIRRRDPELPIIWTELAAVSEDRFRCANLWELLVTGCFLDISAATAIPCEVYTEVIQVHKMLQISPYSSSNRPMIVFSTQRLAKDGMGNFSRSRRNTVDLMSSRTS